MTIILLVRHGHVEGIKPERFRGRADLALTETGGRQAGCWRSGSRRNGLRGSIHTSPLQRCVATGAAIAGLAAFRPSRWAGSSISTMAHGSRGHTTMPAQAIPVFSKPGSRRPIWSGFRTENRFRDVATRTAGVLRFVLSRNAADTVVLVGHDSVNRVLLTQILGMPLSAYWRLAQSPCCINEIEVTGSSFQLRRMNDTAHLDVGIDWPAHH